MSAPRTPTIANAALDPTSAVWPDQARDGIEAMAHSIVFVKSDEPNETTGHNHHLWRLGMEYAFQPSLEMGNGK